MKKEIEKETVILRFLSGITTAVSGTDMSQLEPDCHHGRKWD